MGSSYHPLPWKELTYQPSQGGYVVNLTREQLEGAPTYSASEAPLWDDPGYGRRIDEYYAPFGGRVLNRPFLLWKTFAVEASKPLITGCNSSGG